MTQEEFDNSILSEQILYDEIGMLADNHPSIIKDMEKYHQAKLKKLRVSDVVPSFPSNVEIFKWFQTQKFQKEQGEQEYTMIYEIDLPRILKAFTEHFPMHVSDVNSVSCKFFICSNTGGKCDICNKEQWNH